MSLRVACSGFQMWEWGGGCGGGLINFHVTELVKDMDLYEKARGESMICIKEGV